MANLKVETVPPVVPVKSFVLSLSEDEARTLRDILGRVGGDQDFSRRKHVQEVYNMLYDELGRDDTSDLIGVLQFTEKR